MTTLFLTLLLPSVPADDPPAAFRNNPPAAWTAPAPAPKPDAPPHDPQAGYHWERDAAGAWWQVRDGYKLAAPAVAAPAPFRVSQTGVITRGTFALPAVGPSFASPAGTATAPTPTFALTTGRRGGTNCPPAG